jgi:hypothetical protein
MIRLILAALLAAPLLISPWAPLDAARELLPSPALIGWFADVVPSLAAP